MFSILLAYSCMRKGGQIMTDNKRYRIFNLLLYPDNKQHEKAIQRLISTEFNAVGCLHNCDIYTEDINEHKAGELKKEHYHFVVKFKNNRTISSLAKVLEIEERFIDSTCNFKNSAKYLLHIGCEDKYQYDIDDLVGSLVPDVIKLIDDTTEEVKVIKICNLLCEIDDFVSTSAFITLIAKNGLYSVYRRCCYSFNRVLDEHNAKYVKL